jgi:DNA modification methylase
LLKRHEQGRSDRASRPPSDICSNAMTLSRVDQTSYSGGDSDRDVCSVGLPDEIVVKRSDPIYNAHAYLTKVPVAAIEPFLEAFTSPGDVVLDMYGGSGMTGIAAAMHGRRAEIRDISALGRHIGSNYLNLVDAEKLRDAARHVIDTAKGRIGDVYATPCGDCGKAATLSRTVWTFVYECQKCRAQVNYYESFRAAGWKKKDMRCGACSGAFTARGSRRIAEEPILDTVACKCSPKLRDYEHSTPVNAVPTKGVSWPDVAIGEDRQMFQASALRKHGLITTASFFSKRNLVTLSALRDAIKGVDDDLIRAKLLFAFTGILTRASKRYQWHPKRPLNAANQNYYIAPVFYEWNVYDLFGRKVEAALRSDRHIRERMDVLGVSELAGFNYTIGSANALDLSDESVDYIFIDPPFGSNIFYSDMNLFQEAWLGTFTDHGSEAVVDRSRGEKTRGAERYERLISDSICEAYRVLRPAGWLSIVFSNSNGEMWALLQRSIRRAGFTLGEVTLLSKGQRSVKGLTSGFENVVTVDLIISMQKVAGGDSGDPLSAPSGSFETLVEEILHGGVVATPSHVYLRLVRHYLQQNWDVSELHIREVVKLIEQLRYGVDPTSGCLIRLSEQAA